MRRYTCWLTAMLLALVGLGLGLAEAEACNVPVFRYALEHWRPDAYEAVVFHRGKLSEAEQAVLTRLNDRLDAAGHNVALQRVDLEEPLDDRQQAIFDHQEEPQLPWLVVRYPQQLGIGADVWSGKLTEDTVDALLDSPARQELTKRILSGETAVWLLVEGTDDAANDAARKTLEDEFKRLAKELKLPELTDDPEDALSLEGPPLKIAFSMITIKRDDDREALLRKMLLGSEPDLAERTEPMVFPVFGRGRALLPFVGAGITAENIADGSSFLVGPCSCQVKELNPGFDLVLADRFDEVIGSALLADMLPPSAIGEEVAIPPGPTVSLSTAKANASAEEELTATVNLQVPSGEWAPYPPVAQTVAEPATPTWAKLFMLGGGGLVLITVVLGLFAVFFSSRNKQQGS